MNYILKSLRRCGNSVLYSTVASLIATGGLGFPDVAAFLKSNRACACVDILHGCEG